MRYRVFHALVLFFVMFTAINPVSASSVITTDGYFNDWEGKPQLEDKQGDAERNSDIRVVKWFPDTSDDYLYLYFEREPSSDNKWDISEKELADDEFRNDVLKNIGKKTFKYSYWFITISFDTELGARNACVFYHSPSRKVFVTVFDERNRYIWSACGKWGDSKEIARRVELKIPMYYLMKSEASGYRFDFRAVSGSDRIPDKGGIMVSTVSTFPWLLVLVVPLVCIGFLKIKRLRSRNL